LFAEPQTVLSLPGQDYAQMPSSSRGRNPISHFPNSPLHAAATADPARAHVANLYSMGRWMTLMLWMIYLSMMNLNRNQ
jgi:hypothetical protein